MWVGAASFELLLSGLAVERSGALDAQGVRRGWAVAAEKQMLRAADGGLEVEGEGCGAVRGFRR